MQARPQASTKPPSTTKGRSAAAGRVFMCELRQLHGDTRRTDAYGRYDDTYAKASGRWMFAGRRYRSMARWPEGVVFPMIQDI